MKRKLIFLLLLTMAVLSGCWDSNEPERMLYINGIGVDFKDGQYQLYAQIIDFTNVAKSEEPLSDLPQVEVGHATGRTVDEAIFQLYHSIDQKVFWGHMSYIVVSEEVMKNDELSPIIDLFIRYRETRYQIWVYATKDSVEEVLLLRPVINRAITLSKLGDPENSFKQESFIDPMNIRKVIIDMNEPSHEAMIPLIRIDENWTSINEAIKAPVLAGVGVATPNGFKGFIEGDDVRGMQWMSNDTERGQITFKDDSDKAITVNIEKVKLKVEPVVRGEDFFFDVDVELEATISVIEGQVTIDEIREGIIKKVKKEITKTYETALKKDIDIYRLSEQVYRKNLKAWKQHHIDGKVELHEDSIRNLNVKLTKLQSVRKSFKETIE
ncbi:Ger(x)C family spore germination protein [Sporosarcina sp. OR05]|uniref:Ger(x)C family spore germination protein n=1 Tax=Sporosarcina sp. OR05 TaxID=2969819 RepID=UPI00352B9722